MSTIPTKAKLDKYAELGLVRSQTHDTLPLTIYVYTEFTTFERLWNNVTLQARGLVIDEKDRCVVRCLPKFFNLEEPKPYNDPFYGQEYMPPLVGIYDKLDGSLIQVVNDEEYGLVVTSKGSFNSDQANWATEIIEENSYQFDKGFTYIFELIHPDNRIVVNYSNEKKLVLLAKIHTEKGKEFPIDYEPGFNIVNKMEHDEYLEHMKKNNVEGVILQTVCGTRVKAKTEEYVRLHRIVTNYSEKTIWEMLKEGEEEMPQDMPEEFEEWYKETKYTIETMFGDIECLAKSEHRQTEQMTDKEIGLHKGLKYKNLVFMMRNGKDYKQAIWKMVKPKKD